MCKSKLSQINKNLVVSFSVDPCASAPVVGPCKGTFPRWYYDQNAGECKHFLYGGCQGNHNNFLQQSDCVSECIQKSENLQFLLFCLFNLILQQHQYVIILHFSWKHLSGPAFKPATVAPPITKQTEIGKAKVHFSKTSLTYQ